MLGEETREERIRMPAAFLAGLIVVALLIGAALLVNRLWKPAIPESEMPLPVGPAEQAYIPQIQFSDPKMSRAANFLNQEVTFIFGTVENTGNRPVRQVEITLEFHDIYGQMVQRETHRLMGTRAAPLAAGESRDFQLSFDHISEQWNQVYPTIQVTGLAFK